MTWLTARDFAAEIGVRVKRFHELRIDGCPIPPHAHKIGNAMLWRPIDVRRSLPAIHAWRAAHRHGGARS
jgi:hypothetical protein